MSDLVGWSLTTAERFMAPLGRRWIHVRAVGQLAREIGPAFGELEHVLIASAYLHDIGYAPELAITRFHPLDGARYLREEGHELIARLVAHHSGARIEARLRGLADFELEFPFQASPLDDALTFCDLSTSPVGKRVSIDDRVDEIAQRYGLEVLRLTQSYAGETTSTVREQPPWSTCGRLESCSAMRHDPPVLAPDDATRTRLVQKRSAASSPQT